MSGSKGRRPGAGRSRPRRSPGGGRAGTTAGSSGRTTTTTAPARAEAPPAPASPAAVELAAAGGPPGWAELALRISGAVVSVLLAGLVAAFGAFLTPFRIGTALVPVSLVIAIGGIAGLTWFAYTVTRHRLLGLLPGVVWIAVTFLAATRTHEGDLVLISTDWVASVYLLLGPLALAACAYRLLAPTRR